MEVIVIDGIIEMEGFLSSPSCRRRMQPFVYDTSMVQQIELIIYTNIQPLPALFPLKVKVIGQG